MRTLLEKALNDNMQPLVKLLAKHKIPFTIKRHIGSPKSILPILGYYPAGEWHIMIDNKVSVIRGYASFGDYEIYRDKYEEPERFSSAKALLEDYMKKYKLPKHNN